MRRNNFQLGRSNSSALLNFGTFLANRCQHHTQRRAPQRVTTYMRKQQKLPAALNKMLCTYVANAFKCGIGSSAALTNEIPYTSIIKILALRGVRSSWATPPASLSVWRAIIWAAFLQSTGARVLILGGTQARSVRLCCWYIKRCFVLRHACAHRLSICDADGGKQRVPMIIWLIISPLIISHSSLYTWRGRAPFAGWISWMCKRVTIWGKWEREGEQLRAFWCLCYIEETDLVFVADFGVANNNMLWLNV